MAAIGSTWDVGTWADDAWGANTWGEAAERAVPPVDLLAGASGQLSRLKFREPRQPQEVRISAPPVSLNLRIVPAMVTAGRGLSFAAKAVSFPQMRAARPKINPPDERLEMLTRVVEILQTADAAEPRLTARKLLAELFPVDGTPASELNSH